jgi:hypothetical protein
MDLLAALLPLSLAWSPTPGPAPAEAPEVAVLDLAVDGALPPQWAQALGAALREGLARGRFAVVEPDPPAPGCVELACLDPAARSAVRYVVTARVEVDDRNYTVDVALVDARTGSSVAGASDACEVCGLADVSAQVSALGASLRDKLDALVTAAPVLQVSTRPGGASVRLDGELRGSTPVEISATPGRHRLELHKSGYVVAVRELELIAGVRERIEVQLDAEPSASSPMPRPSPAAEQRIDPRPRRRTIVGAALLGGGVAVSGIGAALWGIDSRPVRSRCTGADRDPFGECRWLHDTRTAGIALVAVGAAAAISGAIVLAVRHRLRRSPRRR